MSGSVKDQRGLNCWKQSQRLIILESTGRNWKYKMGKQITFMRTFIVVVVVTVIFIGLKIEMNPSSQDVSHKDKIRYKHPTRSN